MNYIDVVTYNVPITQFYFSVYVIVELFIQEQYNSSPVYLSAFTPYSPPADPSSIVIFLTAVITVLLASFIANSPFEFLRYGVYISYRVIRFLVYVSLIVNKQRIL